MLQTTICCESVESFLPCLHCVHLRIAERTCQFQPKRAEHLKLVVKLPCQFDLCVRKRCNRGMTEKIRKERSTFHHFPICSPFLVVGFYCYHVFPSCPLFGVLIPVVCFVFWSPTLSTLHYLRFETHVFPLYFHSIPIIFPFYSHYVPMRSHYIPLRILYVRVRSQPFPSVYIYI